MFDADGGTPAIQDGPDAPLRRPGLVVLAGGPGIGRTTALRSLAARFRGPVFTGGGLATLRHLPGMALSRAVRARLPERDVPLAAEAVRARVGEGLLVVDDVHHADPLSLAVLPLLADVSRVLIAIRTPGGLPPETEAALRAAAVRWTVLPGLDPAAARELARQVAPTLDERLLAAVLARAGGNPLAIRVLAARAVAGGLASVSAGEAEPGISDEDSATGALDRAVAAAVADLPRPARTALAALGLLGRPASPALLGPGVPELTEAGWVTVDGDLVVPRPRYLAEVAAAVLPVTERTGLHRRLADLLPGLESARHRAAGGDAVSAYRTALGAVRAAATVGDRAAALLLAVESAVAAGGVPTDSDGGRPRSLVSLRLEAAEAALAAGDTTACRRVLPDPSAEPLPVGDRVRTAVLRAEASLQAGTAGEALAAVSAVPAAGAPDVLRAEHTRVTLLAALSADATGAAARAVAVPGELAGFPAVRVGLAALAARDRRDGWIEGLTAAASAALADGRPVDAWWSGWLLTEHLLADGRITEAGSVAGQYRAACAGQLAYSWETRFAATELWCGALLGADLDTVVRGAVDLLDRTLPAQARSYALAAASLALADTGALAPARTRLDRDPAGRAAGTGRGPGPEVVRWVDREVSWLDGQPDRALEPDDAPASGSLAGGLGAVTTRWARHDLRSAAEERGDADLTGGGHRLLPVRATLSAWAGVEDGTVVEHTPPATAFEAAAALWQGSALREQIRCLLAAGLSTPDADRALPPLLAAEKYAEHAGLTVLLGRVHRALRRYSVRRATIDRTRTRTLTAREREVLALVAAGEPTRRIAGQLGISRETVETHVRAGMRKLGARTRTEAATLVLAGAE
ncbi:helix-turn-helix transcriptional regulator [Cryptosporangium arvum]|uniref:helix-turn-helix transcriptional regulator n=1 Tax=Cryptosporangium arvum TaxID=80871 RepID=UPI0004B1BAF0|nr:LuxR C-terminal-related transcriptional regulator [Cryptosporangium arvum]